MVITTKVTDTPAVRMVAFYREPHRIVPVARFDGTGHYCAHDGVSLDPRKGGFTHRVADIYRAQEEAGHVPVGKCRSCGKTFAAHIRGLILQGAYDRSAAFMADVARVYHTTPERPNTDGLADNTLGIAKHDFIE